MLTFAASAPLTLGVELELQLIDKTSRDLTPASPALLERLADHPKASQFKPEITQSMIELNSSVHQDIHSLGQELRLLRDEVIEAGDQLGIGLCGGGTHPFQHWADRQIYPTERFEQLADDFGYLARRFTVFGQHIHIGVPNGDVAVYLSQLLLRYMPHFIALAASSPYHLGYDTGLDCSRLAAIWTFPLAGHMPQLRNWAEFHSYFQELQELGVAASIKDLYWDVRPKPEFGTVEIRIMDTPLTIGLATDLAGYAQTLAKHLLDLPWQPIPETLQMVHRHNLFQACRHSFQGRLTNPFNRQPIMLRDDLLATLDLLWSTAKQLGTEAALARLAERVRRNENGATAARQAVSQGLDLPGLASHHCQLFRHED